MKGKQSTWSWLLVKSGLHNFVSEEPHHYVEIKDTDEDEPVVDHHQYLEVNNPGEPEAQQTERCLSRTLRKLREWAADNNTNNINSAASGGHYLEEDDRTLSI